MLTICYNEYMTLLPLQKRIRDVIDFQKESAKEKAGERDRQEKRLTICTSDRKKIKTGENDDKE